MSHVEFEMAELTVSAKLYLRIAYSEPEYRSLTVRKIRIQWSESNQLWEFINMIS